MKVQINKRVLINRINSGEKYLYIKNKSDFYPLFLKQEIIEKLIDIGYSGTDKIKAVSMLGEKQFSILYKLGILGSCDSEIQMPFYNFENELLMLNHKSYESRTPMLAKYEITYACNYRCKHCYVNGIKGNKASTIDIKNTIEQIKKNNIPELYITGGEPLMHPDIVEILQFCEKIKMPVTVQSNAALINEEFVNSIRETNMIRFAISFHDADENLFNEFVQTEGAFNMTLKGIRCLESANIPFYLKVNVTSENEKNIKETIDYIKDKYSFKIFSQIFPQIADKEDMSKYVNSSKTLEWLYENNYIEFSKSKCSAGRLKLWIAPDGSVYPCEMIRECVGNIYSEKFETIWNGDGIKQYMDIEEKIYTEKCKQCNLKEYCNACPAYLLYKNWSIKLDGFCENAKIASNVSRKRDINN